MGLIDQNHWRLAVDRAAFGVNNAGSHFYTALSLEAWLAFGEIAPKRDFLLVRTPPNP